MTGARRRAAVAGLVLGAALPGRAGADEVGPLAAPTALPAQRVAGALALEVATGDGRAYLSPDLWYGVSDGLTLGLTHSHRPDGTVGGDRGVCVTNCLAGDGRHGGFTLAAHFALGARGAPPPGGVRLVGLAATTVDRWSPARASFVVGGLALWRGDRLWAQVGPSLSLGLLGRAGGNRERVGAHVTLGAALAAPIGVEAGLGVDGPATADFFGGAAAPLWGQLVLRPRAEVGVGIAIGTTDALGDSVRGYAALTLALRSP